MRHDVIHLEKFYAGRLGQAAQAMAARRLSSVWPDLSGQDVLAYGYGYPYVTPYLSTAKRVVLAMPAEQGASAQASKRGNISCLVQDDLLPFADAQFDNVLAVHAAEETENLQVLLSELWRVTKPEGRLIVIAPNRAGLWARSDKSPFGAGRPFSRTQMRTYLRAAGFEPMIWSGALYAPPFSLTTRPGALTFFEKFGETVWPNFSGLVLVEAIKRLYAQPKGRQGFRVSRPIFGAAPIGTKRSGNTASRE